MASRSAANIEAATAPVGAELFGTLQSFEAGRYPLRELLLGAINGALRRRGRPVGDLSCLHEVGDVVTVEELYRVCYGVMEEAPFRQAYRALLRERVVPLFEQPLRTQRKPAIRLQLPGGRTVQYHTDEWYGHGRGVINCWLPLTPVFGTNSLQVASWADSVREVRRLEQQALSMSEMNDYLAAFVRPIEADFGRFYIFNAQCVHGTQPNATGVTRASLDFRLLPEGADAGSKSAQEYFEGDEAEDSAGGEWRGPTLMAAAYLYNCFGFTRFVSKVNQRLVVQEFARKQAMRLVTEETEIMTMAHHPILLDLARGRGTHTVSAVVLFSVLCLPDKVERRRRILDEAQRAGVRLFFANEGLEWPRVGLAEVEHVRRKMLDGNEHGTGATD